MPESTSLDPSALVARLQPAIDALWEDRASLSAQTTGEPREVIDTALDALDSGVVRVAEPAGEHRGQSGWVVNQWLKKAVLLSFRLTDSTVLEGPAGSAYFDKVPLKFVGWDKARFTQAGMRVVPGAVVRRSAYVAPGVIVMPSFINVGAHVGAGTMIDTWATVGSCAQVGRDCHISGGVGLGGVLEPLQAGPVIIEDGCFIGARSEIAEGVVVGRGSVISMGVFIGASTKIVDRATGEVFLGHVPPYSVVVPGALPPLSGSGPSLACAVIVKRVDERTRAKTAINDLLRD